MSGRKNNLLQYQVMSSVSMASNIVSSVTNIAYLDNIGIQFNYSGSPLGAFNVQISGDYNQDNNGNVLNPGNWINLTLSPAPAASGTTGQAYVDIFQISAPWIRTTYTASSGTGFLSVYITAKMV